MKIDQEKFKKKLLRMPDARMGTEPERKRSRKMMLLLAGDKRMERQLTLEDISGMFTDAPMLWEFLNTSLGERFKEGCLVDSVRTVRRAV